MYLRARLALFASALAASAIWLGACAEGPTYVGEAPPGSVGAGGDFNPGDKPPHNPSGSGTGSGTGSATTGSGGASGSGGAGGSGGEAGSGPVCGDELKRCSH